MTKSIVENKLELLSRSAWGYKDIMEYFPKVKSAPTAILIKNRAIREFDGKVKYGDEYATVESILNLFGTNRDYEIKALKNLLLNSEIIIASQQISFDEVLNEEELY